MGVMDRDLGQLRHPQSQFDPCFAPIERHLLVGRREELAINREKTPIPVVPAPKLVVPGPNVTKIRLRYVYGDIIVVVIEDGMPVDRKRSVLIEGLLEVEVLDPAKNVAGYSVLLLKLRRISVNDQAADPKLDPILGLFFGGRGGCFFRSVSGTERTKAE